jgi:hypothetical protein
MEGELRNVITHQRHIGGLERDCGSRATHCNAHRGVRECRSVVDAITDHGHLTVLRQQFPHCGDLVFRQELGLDLVQTDLPRDRLAYSAIIARQHGEGADVYRTEPLQDCAHRFAWPVGDADRSEPPLAVPHRHRAAPGILER